MTKFGARLCIAPNLSKARRGGDTNSSINFLKFCYLLKVLSLFTERSFLDVWQDHEQASAMIQRTIIIINLSLKKKKDGSGKTTFFVIDLLFTLRFICRSIGFWKDSFVLNILFQLLHFPLCYLRFFKKLFFFQETCFRLSYWNCWKSPVIAR